jgi:mRNA-degrading endonuclease RelE of RelBE toxin-antitoxin system
MIRYRIEMSRTVRDIARRLPPQLKRKFKDALRRIADDPHKAKELQDELTGLMSYRRGRTRVIYRIQGAVLQIVAFGPRIDIYERAAVELSLTIKQKSKSGSR